MAAPTPDIKASWPPPNFENPENLHALVLGITVPAFALAVICECLQSHSTRSGCSQQDYKRRIRKLVIIHGRADVCPVVVIRFYGKGLLRQILGWDDYIMLIAMVSIAILVYTTIVLTLHSASSRSCISLRTRLSELRTWSAHMGPETGMAHAVLEGQ